jgi:fructokinase
MTIILFGEALIDSFPDADVLGGAPFNVACALGAFGTPALLVSALGLDDGAATIRAAMRCFGLDGSGMQTDPFHPTGRVAVELSEEGHRFDILANQAYDHIDGAKAVAAIAAGAKPQMLYFGTMAQRHEVSRAGLQRLFGQVPATRYLDLNLREGTYTLESVAASLMQADILKVNESELLFLLAQFVSPGADFIVRFDGGMPGSPLLPALQSLLDQFSLQCLVVTLGERGYAYLDRMGRMIADDNPAAAPDVVDTVGCGDGFSAVLLHGMQAGWPIETSLARARRFASAVCSVRGGVAPDLAFYRHHLAQWAAEDERSET